MNALELTNMQQRHPLETERDTVQPTDPSWTEVVGDIHLAMQRELPTSSDEAQALAWRWMRLVVSMTRNDMALAANVLRMQIGETGAQQIRGITAQMLGWIDEAFTHARCALFAKYLSPAQADEVRRRQLASGKQRAWPTLLIELRALMEAGVDVNAAPVQAIVKRWRQLFRDSFCGDDAV